MNRRENKKWNEEGKGNLKTGVSIHQKTRRAVTPQEPGSEIVTHQVGGHPTDLQ